VGEPGEVVSSLGMLWRLAEPWLAAVAGLAPVLRDPFGAQF